MTIPEHVPALTMSSFSYKLPSHYIAQHPTVARDGGRLLVRDAEDQIKHLKFTDISLLLPQGSVLVVNATRVIAARIMLQKPTGGGVEVLLTDPIRPLSDHAVVLASSERSVWRSLIGGKNVTPGLVLTDPHSSLSVTVIERNGSEAVVELSWPTDESLSAVLENVGTLPLPPYLHRVAEEADEERYQTIYASLDGSVAAPTAGLHFTEAVFEDLSKRDITRVEVTLHVGLGTFRPVEAPDARFHLMHTERFGVHRSTIEQLYSQSQLPTPWITAVGTTSIRTLESAFCVGAREFIGQGDDAPVSVGQWEAYNRDYDDVSRTDALGALLARMDRLNQDEFWGTTSILLAPGCRMKMADALVTNFHQPGNTLLLLVAAYCGNESWKEMYNEALAENYRFLSYGDSSLIIRTKQ